MINELVYSIAVWLDDTQWSTMLHESYYMYNWVESTHVLTLMLSLGMLFLIDLRMLGYALPDMPASRLAERLNIPMLIGFTVMFITGILLFYAVPVRTSQSLWFRIKMVLLVACAVNAFLFHKQMNESAASWENEPRAPSRIRMGAILSLAFWSTIVVCGRFIAYDWFDCDTSPNTFIDVISGCVDGQIRF
ncbi:MAG TPA: hypothetical protein DHV53_02585 [Gammaproteobacteria bacterium]|nr:hypothetical protein [Gammaproteobacteria bacterium]HBJ89347.1 hypothetical protein [Gammaproteobacteria bacterium]HCA36951.1 hypothetical protein [Gammaproteobacteria bacterium]HCI87512.1 hypothetical protein [Gammaproteobacteria bacterium]HCL73231.1 hypothetical protein [Gammaproteobacteria bacterium]